MSIKDINWAIKLMEQMIGKSQGEIKQIFEAELKFYKLEFIRRIR